MRAGYKFLFLSSAVGAAVCLLARTAFAHSGISNEPLGFVAGFLHPLAIPGHLLAILISAILAGQQGIKALGHAVIVFSLAFIFGLVLSGYYAPPPEITFAFPVLTILCGILVVISIKLPTYVYLPLMAAASGLIALDSDLVAGRNSVFATSSGAFVSSFFVFLYLGLLVGKIYGGWPDWMKIGVRTVGSWIAAVSLLTLALMFRP